MSMLRYLMLLSLLWIPRRGAFNFARSSSSISSYSSTSTSLFGSKTRESGLRHDEIKEFKLLENKDGSREGVPAISWYPGHIAKAERELSDYLKKVDVVIEVRDARIPLSTTHPNVPEWVGNRPLIVAIARLDQISDKALREWKEYYAMYPAHEGRPNTKVYFIDGKLGKGVLSLKKQALLAADKVNERRKRRGIMPRAVRAAIIGFPNVGKSALINRLLGKKMAKSRNMPGVTRSMQWVRIGKSLKSQEGAIELLDSPGIIPAVYQNQEAAVKLAICNDIGEASYDRVIVASALCDHLTKMHKDHPSYVDMARLSNRYKLPFSDMTGEEIIYEVAETYYKGNSISASDKILGDFRRGFMGLTSLEAPDMSSLYKGTSLLDNEKAEKAEREKQETPASPLYTGEPKAVTGKGDLFSLDVGRGEYDGW